MRPFIPQQGQARTSLTCRPVRIRALFWHGREKPSEVVIVPVEDQRQRESRRPAEVSCTKTGAAPGIAAFPTGIFAGEKNSPSILPPRSASQNSVFLTSFG